LFQQKDISQTEFLGSKEASILIVDDDPITRALCSKALKDFHIVQAQNGQEAMAMLAEREVDLVLSDVIMPYMSGLDQYAATADHRGQGAAEEETQRSDSSLQLIIADNGRGIPAGEMNKVFEKFYQVDPDHTGQVRGFGLGLFYARQFMHDHGGQLHLQSSGQNGTQAVITLPRSSPPTS
jgi:CheY-like chemotaxis protein